MTDALLWTLLDLMLAGLLLGLAWAALSSPDLRRGVVLFIAFGLLMALVWARLRAPDLALAEAAIGAGLSGALLLAALRDEPGETSDTAAGTGLPGPLVTVLSGVTGVAVAWALMLALDNGDPVRLAGRVAEHIKESGVTNPVTAVLLNFRAYDTLLEFAVLLAAALGIMALGPERPPYHAAGPVLGGLIHWLVPLLVVTAGYMLWAGAHAPGGAFQAGALLAAAAVLIRLGGRPDAGLPPAGILRWLLAGGTGVFLAVGTGVTVSGRAFLQYPAGQASALILLIEAAATLAIGATLAVAYLGGQPRDRSDSRPTKPSANMEKPH